MAILTSCCCGYTLRQGSYGAGFYTLVYFIIFALLTGNYSYHELMSRYSTPATPTPTSQPNPSHPNSTNSTNPSSDQSQLYPMPLTEVLLVAVDFVCEICGIIASILLLRGLQSDKRRYLLPWLVIVPLHTLIDTFTVINIVIMYVEFINQVPASQIPDEETAAALRRWGAVTALTVVVDFILNSINVYVFLCVLSQYQEYVGGRGSAAYENCVREATCGVRYEVGADPASSCRRNNHPRFSDDKSDMWCNDLVLDKLDDTDHEEYGARKTSNTSTTRTIKFMEDDTGPSPSRTTPPEDPRVTLLLGRK